MNIKCLCFFYLLLKCSKRAAFNLIVGRFWPTGLMFGIHGLGPYSSLHFLLEVNVRKLCSILLCVTYESIPRTAKKRVNFNRSVYIFWCCFLSIFHKDLQTFQLSLKGHLESSGWCNVLFTAIVPSLQNNSPLFMVMPPANLHWRNVNCWTKVLQLYKQL